MKQTWFENIPEERNYQCPDYHACLHAAALKNALKLGCATCEKKDEKFQQELTDADLVGVLMLLFSIFFPKARRDVPSDIDALKSVFYEQFLG